VSTSVLALLRYHKWFKFSIVAQKTEQWMTIAEDLHKQAGLAIKNPPKKTHPKKPTEKNPPKSGFFWVFFGFEEKKLNFFRIIPFFTQ
jgi:hypothetical protein